MAKKIFIILFVFVMVVMFNLVGKNKISAKESKKKITILFTHDIHDHFMPFCVEENEEILELGGYARLQSAINEEKEKDPNLVLVDAGDFSMGTLFQSIFSSDAPELRTMGKMGYDVTTFGNHEFDFRPEGLSDSLNNAIKSGDKLPTIVQSNMEFPKDENGNITESLLNLKKAMINYGVKEYSIINRGGVKIGVFGIMGKDAASNAPMAEVKFNDAIKKSKDIVKVLKEDEKVDFIICLSHSGIDDNKSKSEDEILAKEVPGINVIISGHTHTKLSNPIVVGNTIIGCCGEFSENLGVIKVEEDKESNWKLKEYRLKEINIDLEEESSIHKTIDEFKDIVQRKYLDNFGMKFDEVLAYTPFSFTSASKIGNKHEEEPLGNLIGDGYIYSVKKAEGEKYEPISVSIVPSGTIRGSFVKGDITVSDVFTVSSLGIGKDRIAGYPLVSAYLTGKELKSLCEVDASVAPIMKAAQLYMSGIRYKFNPNRLIFNKVISAELIKPDGTFEKINDKKLYRIVAGLYSAQMLSVVNEKSHGLLSIVPKDKYGNTINDFESQIINYNFNGENRELKEWVAIAKYIKSFKKINGKPQIPYYYNKPRGRKIVDNSKNIKELVKNPNKIAIIAYSAITGVIGMSSFVIVAIFKHKKSKKING